MGVGIDNSLLLSLRTICQETWDMVLISNRFSKCVFMETKFKPVVLFLILSFMGNAGLKKLQVGRV